MPVRSLEDIKVAGNGESDQQSQRLKVASRPPHLV
jgi:hypothetical protein